MSSGQHGGFSPQQPGITGRRDLVAVLDRALERGADNRWATYVRRISPTRHLVRNPGNPTPYSVAGPPADFEPGSDVLLGSNRGHPGETIIALPSLDRQGTGAYPEMAVSRTLSFPEPPVEAPAGAPYLAVWADTSTRTLYAFEYAGGAYVSQVASISYATALPTAQPAPPFYRVHALGDVVVFGTISPGRYLVTWDVGAGTLTVHDTQPPLSFAVGSWSLDGSSLYYTVSGLDFVPKSIYKVAVGTTGPASLWGTITDPGDGGDWYVFALILPAGTEFYTCSNNQAAFPEEFWTARWDDDVKLSLIGTSDFDTDREAEYIAFNLRDGVPTSVGPVALNNRRFWEVENGQGPLAIMRLNTSTGALVDLVPQGWNLDGFVAYAHPGVAAGELVLYPTAGDWPGTTTRDKLLRLDLSVDYLSTPSPTLLTVEQAPVEGVGTVQPVAMLPRS